MRTRATNRYRDAAQARAAILDRDVYGAFVGTGGGSALLALAVTAGRRGGHATA